MDTTLKEAPFKKLPPTREICNVCGSRWAARIQIKHGNYTIKPCNKCFQRMMKEQRWAQKKKETAVAASMVKTEEVINS